MIKDVGSKISKADRMQPNAWLRTNTSLKDDDFTRFICSTPDSRVLHLKTFIDDSFSYSHAHSISEGTKSNNKNEINRYSIIYKAFAHWLAIDVYEKFCETAAEDLGSVKFVDTLLKLMKLNRKF